ADEQFQRAMRSFKKVKNEPRRLATLYNLSHLAHEQGDAAKAHDLSQAAADLAIEVGMQHVHAAALARVGLAALALGTQHEIEQVARQLTAYRDATPTWFTGRESVEAFMSRHALHIGDVAGAAALFHRAAEALRADPYDSAWLVAECAPLFRASPDPTLQVCLERARSEAERLGFVPLAKRLGTIARGTKGTQPNLLAIT
ncbi:MAG: hypothetical protein ACT4P7_00830, partial [Gemmatimonadaceae bacterium]